MRRHPALRVAERSYNCFRQEPRICPCGDFLLIYLILYRQCPRVGISLKTHLPVATLVDHKVCSLFPREGDLNVEIQRCHCSLLSCCNANTDGSLWRVMLELPAVPIGRPILLLFLLDCDFGITPPRMFPLQKPRWTGHPS